MRLNPQSPIPLYHQLADRLINAILAGSFKVGQRIPSEHALAHDYAIGRPTVRQAIDVLVRKGLLARRRGSGTYVREPRQEVDLFSLEGTRASFQKTGMPTATHLIVPGRVIDVPATADNPFAGRPALFLTRLTLSADLPVLLEEIYMEGVLFPGLEQLDLGNRSLARVAEEHYHLRPTGAKQRFRIAYATGSQADQLKVSSQSPLLFVQRHLHFPHHADGVYVELWCRGDQFVFTQTIGGVDHA